MRARYFALPACLALASCQLDVLEPRGTIGIADKTILVDSLAIMLAIVVPTIVAIFAFAWWFRANNKRAKYLPDWEYSGRIEMIVWFIPALTVILLGGVGWIGAHELDPARPLPGKTPPLEIQAVSLDWKWLFIYPAQHVATVNQLIIPAATPIHFSLTSASVMNVFFIPQLGSMIYTMNGMRTQLNLDANQPGNFRGQSSHYSGDGFSGMHFDVRAVPADQFATWVAATQKSGDALDEAAYTKLTAQSENVAPFTYRAVAAGIFGDVVMQKLPPGPGPKQ
jgi:cytochrome o ubiquinol oxidase subunit 2